MKMMKTMKLSNPHGRLSYSLRLAVVHGGWSIPILVWLVAAVSLVSANPLNGRVVAGEASIAGEGTAQVTITQQSARAILNWDSFSIGGQERTQFLQPSTTTVAANRITGGDPSQIFGRLDATGQVVLINPNGIFFGADARVDVTGLVASVHDFQNDEFMTSTGGVRLTSTGSTKGVENAGRITIRDGGLAALIAPQVTNEGIIQARLGRVEMAAAQGVTVDLYGHGGVQFMPDAAVLETLGDGGHALVEQRGRIEADGGRVYLTAQVAQEVINASVKVSGVVRARSVETVNGVIHLKGPGAVRVTETGVLDVSGPTPGQVQVDAGSLITRGTLLADGPGPHASGGTITLTADRIGLGGTITASGGTGGTIAVTATGLLSLGERVAARGEHGRGGQVQYAGGRIIKAGSATTDVSGATDGGVITVDGGRQLASSGTYTASGGLRGGRIDLTASDLRLFSASLAATGHEQGGVIRVGGAFQGGTPPGSDISRLSTVCRPVGLPAVPCHSGHDLCQ